MLPHDPLRQAGAEFDSLILARKTHFAEQAPQFLDRQQSFFFAGVAKHHSDRRRFIAERQIVRPDVR